MNQAGNAQTVAQLDPNTVENRYCVDANQMQSSSYQYSTAGSDAASWTTNKGVNHTTDNISYSNSSYHYAQPTGQTTNSIQDSSSSASFPSSSTSGTANVAQDYSGHASYTTTTDPYGYGSTGYTSYYNGYQPQPNQSYPQAAGACQNSGAPYQPLSSFQNTGSYVGSASYSGTYYNPANYQTSGGYASTGYTNQTPQGYSSASYSSHTSGGYPATTYNNQTASWNQGNHTNYAANAYPPYTPDTSIPQSSSTVAAPSQHYQQNYKQWADYYSQTEVTCAPGTENLSALGTTNQAYAAPGVSSGIPISNNQPTPSYAQPWRPDNSLSQNPPVQPGAAGSGVYDSYWTHQAPNFQNHHPAPTQNQYLGSSSPKFSYDTFQDKKNLTPPQGLNSQPSHQPSPIYQQPVQTAPSFDTRQVSKLQIPTNPRIPSNFPLGLPKTGKESLGSTKPAYVSVLPQKPDGNADNSMLKSGAFPKSLRGYVERALSRCKDDKEKASCQASLKEIITKARADGTLYSRDWDTEPLLPVLNRDVVNHEIHSTAPISSSLKRSPTRRSKSRWEPLLQEKEFHKPPLSSSDAIKFGGWSHLNEKDKKNPANSQKVDTFSNYRSPLSEQTSANKSIQRPAKRQRYIGSNATVNDDGSSDSDKEESLTPYYSSAMSLANSAEELKRRESRSKRFEKGRGHRRENNLKSKTASAGNLYSRRATALTLSKNFDESGNRAVEDIDWDALTVKGTCQEIEKRYLRLTSAPDPTTVRPEDVLEKALVMVQNSQKNYLYKCDQLKSIRQDLTVQRIHNQLTAKVYETHARFALEAGDLPEYNQCLSQLNTLYTEGIEGCHLEFAAYNLLYAILHSNNNRELLSSMSRLSTDAKKDDAVKHALAVRAAVTSGNYVKFFRLYRSAPNLNTFLMDLYVEKMRYRAVSCMSRANRPTIPVSYIAQVLGFGGTSSMEDDEKDTAGLEECVEWLKAHGASLISDDNGEVQLDAKVSASNLYMPEPEDAVAHGDPNLAVNDFFTKTLS